MTDEERMSRTNWVALLRLCKEQNLPTPVLEPGILGGYNIKMGSFTAHNKVMSIAINSCIDFCDGYRAGIRSGLGLTDHGEIMMTLGCKKCGSYLDSCNCGDMS